MIAARAKRVLVAPLDWGMGHATRCVPVIRALRAAGAEVLLATTGRARAFLRQAFPELPMLGLPSYDVTYPRGEWLTTHVVLQAPRVLWRMREEHAVIARLVREHAIDVVIADNRPGCFSDRAYSVYITHQLRICPPVGAGIVTGGHRWCMRRYDETWVPDFAEEPSLSGMLGHDPDFALDRLHYVGPLSRFSGDDGAASDADPFRLLVLLSGPEPQRTIFEEAVLERLRASPIEAVVVCGCPDQPADVEPRPGLRLVHHLPDAALHRELCRASAVLARPGYSTLCDTSAFGKHLFLVPTPGQPEQQYLARRLEAQGYAVVQRQAGLSLEVGLRELARVRPLRRETARAEDLLRERVRALLAPA